MSRRAGAVRHVRQIVPDDFAAELRRLHAEGDPRLSGILRAAADAGWSRTALGHALYVSREAVRLRVGAAEPCEYAIPDPPRWPARTPRPAPRMPAPDVVERLRQMQAVVAALNGAATVDDPRRKVALEYAALLNRLTTEEGFSLNRLAGLVGVTYQALRARLARFGYLPPTPSMADDAYKGRPIKRVHEAWQRRRAS